MHSGKRHLITRSAPGFNRVCVSEYIGCVCLNVCSHDFEKQGQYIDLPGERNVRE